MMYFTASSYIDVTGGSSPLSDTPSTISEMSSTMGRAPKPVPLAAIFFPLLGFGLTAFAWAAVMDDNGALISVAVDNGHSK